MIKNILINIFVDCNTNIPDRTKAITKKGENQIPEMVKRGVRLKSMDTDFIVMPCNTAHYFYKELITYLDIPLLNMPEESALYLKNKGLKM